MGGGSANLQFPLFFPPTLVALAPPQGAFAGGTVVVLTGFNFRPGAVVTFGGSVATIGNLTPTAITVTVPAHAIGVVDVTVTNSDGQSSTLVGGFAYVLPLVVVGTNFAASSNDDGITWTTRSIPAGAWVDVIYTGSGYIAVDGSAAGKIAITPDGVNWAAGGALGASLWTALAAKPGVIVAMTANSVNSTRTSLDGGLTWSVAQTYDRAGTVVACSDIGIFYTIMGGSTWSSPDGLVWTRISSTGPVLGNSGGHDAVIAIGNNIACAFSSQQKMWNSGDGGVTWNPTTQSFAGNWDIAYNGLIYLISLPNVPGAQTSLDGITFSSPSNSNTGDAVVWTGVSFVMLKNVTSTRRSVDGTNWDSYTNNIAGGVVMIAAPHFRNH
jgi:hypothetical protein